jgi:aminopeptidase YwaD
VKAASGLRSIPQDDLISRSAAHLRALCVDIRSRRVGSEGNQAARRYAAGILRSFGFQVETPAFDCIDWRSDEASVTAGSGSFEAYPSPYSLGCRVKAPLACAATLDELESAAAGDRILLLHGELVREPLMPKNFPFYNPEEHKHLIHRLESLRPAALLTATARNPEMVAAIYPYPMFEDGDFNLPSAFMTDDEGRRLARHAGRAVQVETRCERIPSTGCNVLATKSNASRRVVVIAHIDSRIGTPGANDNASGAAALLLLAERLADYRGPLGVELVAMNGEDYYSNPGEQQYLAANAGRFEEIALGVNLDDIGYVRGQVAFSLYGLEDEASSRVRTVLGRHAGLVEGLPWYQGDHGLFLMNGRPALAMTTDRLAEVMAEITHSARDTIEMVDPAKPVLVARALHDLICDMPGG